MEIPYNPPKENEGIACPECGSVNVSKNEDVDVHSKPDDQKLNQYVCGDCHCVFIPAMEETNMVDKWAKKLRMNETFGQGQTWRKVKKYIVIKKKNK